MLMTILVLAIALDWVFKEPRCWHPLVGFGAIAMLCERKLNARTSKLMGVVAWLIAVLPLVFLALYLQRVLESVMLAVPTVGTVMYVVVSGLILYLAIGWQSLISHALAISEPLARGDLDAARQAVGMIVSRDTSELETEQVAAAATESVLENGADAVFGALFWFVIWGLPGVVLYRLSNTLDAMWGYKNARFVHFGWAAARIDDVLNLIPARLTAISYALVGNGRLALLAWKHQGASWKSPNAGPVMAAGAGAINVRLGGGAMYHGQYQARPALGPIAGEKASAESILRSVRLVNKSLMLWVSLSIVVVSVEAWL